MFSPALQFLWLLYFPMEYQTQASEGDGVIGGADLALKGARATEQMPVAKI